jgi:hypothetical protein
MKKIILLFFAITSVSSFAQNVGIGTVAPPTEKLDVNGNINMNGNLRVNNIAGQPNQVLMTNSTGNTFWGDMGGYKNVASFTQNSIWVIPAGITKIRVEAWGGGGGGASGGGGAGGTYILTKELTVTPGNNITLTIGTGGASALVEASNGTAGGQTIISGIFGSFTATGGNGGSPFAGGTSNVFALIGDEEIQIPGMSGASAFFEYNERTAGQFVEIAKNGNGGGVAPTFNNGGPGGMYVRDMNTSAILKSTAPAIPVIPGTGGGGGYRGSDWGAAGRTGMVIVYY